MSTALVPLGKNEFDANYDLGKLGPSEYWNKYFDESRLGDFKDKAYGMPEGYSVRTNPVTGKKELFVAGTRTAKQWGQNVTEGLVHLGIVNPLGLYSEHKKIEYIEELKDLIEEENIEVVYGHSRGAAFLGGIDLPIQKIGIDGATVLGHHDDFLNINQAPVGGGVFDNLIGFGHKNTIQLKNRKFHDVTRPAITSSGESTRPKTDTSPGTTNSRVKEDLDLSRKKASKRKKSGDRFGRKKYHKGNKYPSFTKKPMVKDDKPFETAPFLIGVPGAKPGKKRAIAKSPFKGRSINRTPYPFPERVKPRGKKHSRDQSEFILKKRGRFSPPETIGIKSDRNNKKKRVIEKPRNKKKPQQRSFVRTAANAAGGFVVGASKEVGKAALEVAKEAAKIAAYEAVHTFMGG